MKIKNERYMRNHPDRGPVPITTVQVALVKDTTLVVFISTDNTKRIYCDQSGVWLGCGPNAPARFACLHDALEWLVKEE